MVQPGRAPDMSQRVLRGLAWVGASQIAMQLTRTVVAIMVARLLVPADYGLAASALIFASLVLVFSDLALGAALVQRKELTELDRSTAFWVTVGSGVVFTVLGLALSGAVANLYGEPDVKPLLMLLSASFLLTSLGATQQSLLLREMNFKRTETLTAIGALAGGAAGVALAALGAGAWAIISQQVAAAAVTSALLWRAASWRPQLAFSRASLRYLVGFSGPLVGHRLLYYLHQNADRFLIARYAGAAALGTYAVAYNLMLIPAARLGAPLQRVLAPAFARMQDEPERIAAAWARAARLLAMVAVPALAGLVVVAPDFVRVVLGDKWAAAIPIVQVLAWVGMLQAVQSINIDILMARGRTATVLRYSIGFCTAHVIAFAIGLHWGVEGVAVAYAVSSTFVEPVLTVLTARCLGVSPLVFLRSLCRVMEAALGMSAAVLGVRLLLVEAGVPAVVRLLALVPVGVAVFAVLSAWRVPGIREDIGSILARIRRRRTPVPALATPVAGDA